MAKPRKRWHEILDRLPAGECHVAEIGVWRGRLSSILLRNRPDLSMTLVDPWQRGKPGSAWWRSGSRMPMRPQADYDAAKAMVEKIAKQHPGRARIIGLPSLDAAKLVADESCDLVFIDGDHSYSAVKADIAAWKPKVRPGGWIGGHDYGAHRFTGLTRAVEQAFRDATIEVGADYTWFVRV